MDTLAILTIICSAEAVGLIVCVATLRSTVRKARAEAKSADIANLEAVIRDLREEGELRKEEREQYRADLEETRSRNEDLREENTAAKLMICTHLGCILRNPAMGQGDNWIHDHHEDPALGGDYLPINQLLRKYKPKEIEQ